MKLITLNVEMKKHYDKVLPFRESEDPDVLCLQEAPEEMATMLQELGYTTSFLPIVLRPNADNVYPEGALLAAKSPLHHVSAEYYFKPHSTIQLENNSLKRESYAAGFIIADIKECKVATTHFTWTPNGADPNEDQKEDLPKLLSMLKGYGPHILCGDMNIPRHHSPLYEDLLLQYTDNVPPKYKSSLDKSIHRLGDLPEKANLFSDFVVDYVFTQPPYRAENVRLEFGLSDHAAVVADIFKDS